MTRTLRPLAMALTICSLLPTYACVINSDDGNDDAADSSDSGSSQSASNSGGSATTSASAGDASASASDSDASASASDSVTVGSASATATDSASATVTDSDSATASASDTADGTGDTGVDVDPQDGAWLYQETGMTTNDCTFIANPSNGFGMYEVANQGGGMFTITPGDGTDPFTCSRSGGDFNCDERLSGTYDIGMGLGEATGNILVGIEGVLDSAVHMTAEQQGRIECEGADCGTAEQVLGVTFPCEFTIPFTGDAQ
jgi:hypothetical protein